MVYHPADGPFDAAAFEQYIARNGAGQAADLVQALRDFQAEQAEHARPIEVWGFQHLRDFLESASGEYKWVVPNMLEAGDRGIVTGEEGHGKSTLLRQWAYQFAMGIHPFTGEEFEPLRVVVLDLENSKLQVARSFRKIIAGRARWPKCLVVRCAPEGLDILDTSSDDAARLRRFVEINQADVLVMGPMYKLVGGNENDNERAKAAVAVLDQIRGAGCVTLLEGHPAKAADDKRLHRPKDPVGASVWRRWPEYGIHLSEQGYLTHWRGPRGDGQFPAKLTRDRPETGWLWAVDESAAAALEPDRDDQHLVYNAIANNPGISQSAIAARTGKRKEATAILAGKLYRKGLIRIEETGRAHRHYAIRPWFEEEAAADA